MKVAVCNDCHESYNKKESEKVAVRIDHHDVITQENVEKLRQV